MSSYEPYHPSSAPRRLVRTRADKMVGGVCGGFAAYLGIDSNLLRILLVAAVVLGFGTPAIAYLVAWALMPQA
ncbi:PspC domain-containing protein [Nocardioides sp. TF02-7]|uniref:PspC domain-containing protein n=1 Tax=Nocardioides sp. TF02-7 TaxID=2917724 RepID=UPI001F06E85A|nr:PspC domain-containing protein [Nocardioides sp. TF02-7]UMG94368.1 PspC domain-containing protein [Nocardioides sp. TF02-7]